MGRQASYRRTEPRSVRELISEVSERTVMEEIAALSAAGGRPLPERSATPRQWTHSPSACCPLVSGGGLGDEGGDRGGLGQVDGVAAGAFGHGRAGAFGHGA